MSAKKIWLWAIVFGVIATALFMFYFNIGDSEETAEELAEASKEKLSEDIETIGTEKEVFVNEILPIADQNRAMSIQVTDVQGVSGFIKQGSFVDVVAILSSPEKAKEDQHDSATVILQNKRILAVGHAADDEATAKRYQMVTLEVTPKEALVLGFSTRYELYLILRNEGDNSKEPDQLHLHEDQLHKGVFVE